MLLKMAPDQETYRFTLIFPTLDALVALASLWTALVNLERFVGSFGSC
jgi:hypothetical protein